MGKRCCAPVIINTGGEESPGGGAVDSVTGLGVVNATPDVGDVEISIDPGSNNQVLHTSGSDVVWGPIIDSGVIESPNITSTDPDNTVDSVESMRWTRVGDIVTVFGNFNNTMSDSAEVGTVNIPLPMTRDTGAGNPTVIIGGAGNFTNATSVDFVSGGLLSASATGNNIQVRLSATRTGSRRVEYSISYVAATP